MSTFPVDQNKIFAASNGGIDIIRRFLPQANERKNFRIRDNDDDKNPSASMFQKDGVYLVYDHGDTGGFYSKSKNAIHIFAKETGKQYFEALLDLGEQYGLVEQQKNEIKYLESCTLQEYAGKKLNENGFAFTTKEFTDYELEIIGPLVTKEHCKLCDLYSLESYSWVKKESGVQEEYWKVFTVKSTPTYPIMAIIPEWKPRLKLEGEKKNTKVEEVDPVWLKIYQPKSKEKGYRFSYLGKKPHNYIFGLERLKNKATVEVDIKDDETGAVVGVDKKIEKIKNVVICSGVRDHINMVSSGKAAAVVEFNSETATISEVEIRTLFKYSEAVINVPDLDPTGIAAGKELALEHMDVKTAWLPQELAFRKDFRGNPLKDFTDFMKTNVVFGDEKQEALKTKVERLLELARPARFWESKYSKRTGTTEYSINHKNAFYFLKLNGFYKVKDENRKDGFYFIKQDAHIIKEVRPQEIKDFFNRCLDEKQQQKGLTYFPDDLLNLLLASEVISEKKLAGLTEKRFDYIDATPHSQFLFFNEFIWEITSDKINKITKGYSRYVKEENLVNNLVSKLHEGVQLDTSKLQVMEPLFSIKKDKEKNYQVSIHTQECEYMNYIINGSRVFWEEEMADLTDDQQIEYKKNNPSSLTSDKLTEEQNYTQEMHFVNKCFSIGYLLHNFKSMSRSWALIGMDDKIVDEQSSHGRTGKSLTWSAGIRCFKNTKYKGARRKEVLDGQFLYEGVTDETRYLLFDDANEYFRYEELFTDITGDMSVNRKNMAEFNLSFYKSPKICITTNFSLKNLNPSLYSRLLISSFSNFYHGFNADEGIKEFSPRDHFGHDFFSQWDDKQWHLFINFYAQCLQFYLGTREKIEAPQNNIRKRNLIADLGPVFREFMDKFLENPYNHNRDVFKDDLFKEVIAIPQLKNYTTRTLKTKVAKYCELEGYTFSPEHLWNSQKRIVKDHPATKISGEVFIFNKIEELPPQDIAKPMNAKKEDSIYNMK